MKIVISASYGDSLIKFRGDLIKKLVSLGHEVICMSGEDESVMAQRVRELGASYVKINLSRTGTGVFSNIATKKSYEKALRQLKPDIYFAYMSKPIAFGVTAAKKAGVPHIFVLVTGLEIAFYSGGLKNALVRAVLKHLFKKAHRCADKVFFQNQDDENSFLKMRLLEKEKCVLVSGSGVNMNEYPLTPLPNEPVFLMMARLVKSKGVFEYAAAAKRIKKEIPECRALLLGALDENSEAMSKAELDECVSSGIEYFGYAEDVRPYISQCSVYVLPSYHEGTPRSVLEAMAMGRAIITTDAPGCRETVLNNGIKVPIKDENALFEAMKQLALTKNLREEMGKQSYLYCKERFAVEKVNDIIVSVILQDG